MALWLVYRRAPRCASTAIVLGLYVLCLYYHICVSLSWAGSKRRSAPRLVALLERYVLEHSVGVGVLGLRHFLELHLLGPMGSYGAVLGPVTLARLLSDYHRLEPLADEIVGVELLVRGEAPVQARLEEVPGLGANLHTVFDAPVRVVDELETLVLALRDAVPHLELRAILLHGLRLHDLQHVSVGGAGARILEPLVSSRYFFSVSVRSVVRFPRCFVVVLLVRSFWPPLLSCDVNRT